MALWRRRTSYAPPRVWGGSLERSLLTAYVETSRSCHTASLGLGSGEMTEKLGRRHINVHRLNWGNLCMTTGSVTGTEFAGPLT
ncbi:hypothetical protein [Desulfosporosinus acidiphilus]|uniref:hypothetical protein n=1 Tax=Desulfosporosinus acidiphilus TaxID=885581 RepID=UPI0011D1C357|nr:hypothetical protein [Desulfosporosinus acidiphilus]